jgi:hypothetical protein
MMGGHATVETITITALATLLGLVSYIALRGRMKLGEPAAARLRLAALATLLGTLAALAVHFEWEGIQPWRMGS